MAPADRFRRRGPRTRPDRGGTYRITFTGETDEFADFEHSFGGTYRELDRGERIVYTDRFESDDPAMAGEMTVTVTFETVTDGTKLTVHQTGIPDAIPPSDANEGWTDSLGNLAAIVAADEADEATA